MSSLLSGGQQNQAQALASSNTDELVPIAQPSLLALQRRLRRPVSDPIPLTTLLVVPRSLLAPVSKKPRVTSENSSLTALERRKLNKKASYREKRCVSRRDSQQAAGTLLKEHVQRPVQSAESVVVDLLPIARGSGWTGLQAPGQAAAYRALISLMSRPSVSILASTDVFKISGLKLIVMTRLKSGPTLLVRSMK